VFRYSLYPFLAVHSAVNKNSMNNITITPIIKHISMCGGGVEVGVATFMFQIRTTRNLVSSFMLRALYTQSVRSIDAINCCTLVYIYVVRSQ